MPPPFPQTRHVRVQEQEVGRGFVGADRDGVPAGAEAGLREPGRDTFPGGVPRARGVDRTGSSVFRTEAIPHPRRSTRRRRPRGDFRVCGGTRRFLQFCAPGPGADHCYHDDVTAIGYSHGNCSGDVDVRISGLCDHLLDDEFVVTWW